MNMNEQIALIEFGLGGWRGASENGKAAIAGYDDVNTFVKYSMNQLPIPDCTPVLDKCNVLRNRPELAIIMPMVDTSLEHNDIDKCPEPNDTLLLGLEGAFKSLAMMRKIDHSFRGLDKVSLVEYLRLWLEQGARLGYKQGNTIVWLE